MAKFQFTELVPTNTVSARLGASAAAADRLSDNDVGKFVKLAGESRYDLTASGNQIEGFLNSVEAATLDGYAFGAVASDIGTFKEVTFGAALAIGDYVVAGTPVARGTKLSAPAAVIKEPSGEDVTPSTFRWRVVSLGKAGTGAAGTVGVIQRVS